MAQSKQRSRLEVICNTLSGLIVAYFVWNFVVAPLATLNRWNMNDLDWSKVTTINVIFTTVSIIRSYFWRRLFNKGDTL